MFLVVYTWLPQDQICSSRAEGVGSMNSFVFGRVMARVGHGVVRPVHHSEGEADETNRRQVG